MTKRKTLLILLASSVMSTAVLAHTGVKDPTVKARMDLMSSIGATTKSLGTMAKSGSIDPAQVVENANALAAHARQIQPRFADPATDPKSESLPVIWDEMERFLKIADDLETAALELAGDPESLPVAMRAIGKTCGSCHETFRIEK